MLHRYSGKPPESPAFLDTSLRLFLFSRQEVLRIAGPLWGHSAATPPHRHEAFSLTVTVSATPIPFQSADLHTMFTHRQYWGMSPDRTFLKNAEFGSGLY